MKKPIQDRKVSQEVAEAVAAMSGSSSGEVKSTSTTEQVSFAADIMPLFKQFQGPMMWRFDLTEYDAVLGNAQLIFHYISTHQMPPPPFPPLTEAQIQTFEEWMKQGCPP